MTVEEILSLMDNGWVIDEKNLNRIFKYTPLGEIEFSIDKIIALEAIIKLNSDNLLKKVDNTIFCLKKIGNYKMYYTQNDLRDALKYWSKSDLIELVVKQF